MNKELLYLQIANSIETQILNNSYKVGEKLHSLRTICQVKGVSLSTATQAYLELESRGLIESRPQSGYYVSFNYKTVRNVPTTSLPLQLKPENEAEDIFNSILNNYGKADIYLSSGLIDLKFLPVAKLNKAIIQATRELPDSGINYNRFGNTKLKQQVALRSYIWGGKLQENDIITTAGCMDAITFCMHALLQKGDTIAIESPIYISILQLAKYMGLNIIELPTNPVSGVEIEALKEAIEKKKTKLVLLLSNYSIPMACYMPEENKKEIVKLLEKHNVPLIEDDLFGDLYFGNHRPSTFKSYDESGLVLWCGSVSKTLAPGYRVGWVAPGKFKAEVEKTKFYHSLYCNTITHEAIGSFLENGRYESHLRKLRQNLHRNCLLFLRAISEYFPDDTKVTRPQGGMQLWIELNKKVNTVEMYNKAFNQKISMSPGRIYTLLNQYNNCFKIDFGMMWNEKIDNALKILGKLAGK